MADNIERIPLVKFLKSRSPKYFGKLFELRDAVSGWIEQVPATFPHYTRHTLEHSQEIIAQCSKLLFIDKVRKKCCVDLSPTEAYILIAAAYLHDAGMVVSDVEKRRILESDEWKTWTIDGGGTTRWRQVAEFREGNQPKDKGVRDFLADLQVRYLIAEFVRRTHHHRTSDLLLAHEAALGRFAFGDPILTRTIASVCEGHGLSRQELQDGSRFPDECDIRGDKVNVRFLAILLRIGDLLDLSHERACPLLLSANCPLPADSLAHWTQYQCVTLRNTTPEEIHITAECQTQDEHRLLQDWCQWLVDEVHEAATLMRRSTRHHEWEAPVAELEPPDSQQSPTNATIAIRPAPNAAYFPSRWKFDLDADAIFERLVYDTYSSEDAFIRELIQNAADACRTRMYLDLATDGEKTPEYPTQVSPERRNKYSILVSLVTETVRNELSGADEPVQILSVEDNGIGMDRDIVERFFLQVGRSYYQTSEFRRQFHFNPASLFGVGFLSVFGASDHVVVESYKPSSARRDSPVRLTLTGPRSYFLTERSARTESGTSIRVRLRRPLGKGALVAAVIKHCKRLEFPVRISDLGDTQELPPGGFVEEFSVVPLVGQNPVRIVYRTFRIDIPGIEGRLIIVATLDNGGERWDRLSWLSEQYPLSHPMAKPPQRPSSFVCAHGIQIWTEDSHSNIPVCFEVDIRLATLKLGLNRTAHTSDDCVSVAWSIIDRVLESIVREHFRTARPAQGPEGWKYMLSVIATFTSGFFSKERMYGLPNTVRILDTGNDKRISLVELFNTEQITVSALWSDSVGDSPRTAKKAISDIERQLSGILLPWDVYLSLPDRRETFWPNRYIKSIHVYSSGVVVLESCLGDAHGCRFDLRIGYAVFCSPFHGTSADAIAIQQGEFQMPIVALNANSTLGYWFRKLLLASSSTESDVEFSSAVHSLGDIIYRSVCIEDWKDLKTYINKWNALPNLPEALHLRWKRFRVWKPGLRAYQIIGSGL